jgi:alkylated DNA repair protein (DNA oxidative demethylase)
MNQDLFDDPAQWEIAPGVTLLRGFALASEQALLDAVAAVTADAPLRNMHTPGGLKMAVALTNCGPLGWVSDAAGYRYQASDPVSGLSWPALPAAFAQLAAHAAASAGFGNFTPDACLVNRYQAGTRLSLHQDRNERDFSQPIVSVSLGLPAVFLLGGLQRNDKTARLPLNHGDVLVWGGPSRLRFHGVLPLMAGTHPLLGDQRINLTLRRAR